MAYRGAERDTLSDHVDKNLGQTGAQEEETKNGTGSNEGEEVTVVSSTNAVIKPDTMMVLCLDTVVTYSTMVASRRPPNIASLAVLGWHFHGGSRRLGGFDHGPVVCGGANPERIFVLIWRWHLVEVSRKDLGTVSEEL